MASMASLCACLCAVAAALLAHFGAQALDCSVHSLGPRLDLRSWCNLNTEERTWTSVSADNSGEAVSVPEVSFGEQNGVDTVRLGGAAITSNLNIGTDVSARVTLEAVFRLRGASASTAYLLAQGLSAPSLSSRGIILRHPELGGQVIAASAGASYTSILGTPEEGDNQWLHVVVSYAPGVANVYVNCDYIQPVATVNSNSATGLTVGGTSGNEVDAELSLLRVYVGVSLTKAQVCSNFQAEARAFMKPVFSAYSGSNSADVYAVSKGAPTVLSATVTGSALWYAWYGTNSGGALLQFDTEPTLNLSSADVTDDGEYVISVCSQTMPDAFGYAEYFEQLSATSLTFCENRTLTVAVENTSPLTANITEAVQSGLQVEVQIQFSEVVASISTSDFVLSNCSAPVVLSTSDHITFTLTSSCAASGVIGINVSSSNNIKDQYGFGLSGAASVSAAVAFSLPLTASISLTTASVNQPYLVYGVTFSRAVASVSDDDFAVSGEGTVEAVIPFSGAAYVEVVVRASGTGTVSLTLSESNGIVAASDSVPLTGAPLVGTSRTVASVNSVGVSPLTNTASNKRTAVFRVLFSSAVQNFDAADLQCANCQFGPSIVSSDAENRTFEVVVAANVQGTMSLWLKNTHDVVDVNGVRIASDVGSPTSSVYYQAPLRVSQFVPLPVATVTNNAALTFLVQFTSNAFNIDPSDFIGYNTSGSLSVVNVYPGSYQYWNITVTAVGSGRPVAVGIRDSNNIVDSYNFPLTSPPWLSSAITYYTPLTMTFGATPTNSNQAYLDFQAIFSASAQNVIMEKFLVSGATCAFSQSLTSVSGSVYSIRITPSVRTCQLQLCLRNSTGILDAVGLPLTTLSFCTSLVSFVPPLTVTIVSSVGQDQVLSGRGFSYLVSFSAPVTGFSASSLLGLGLETIGAGAIVDVDGVHRFFNVSVTAVGYGLTAQLSIHSSNSIVDQYGLGLTAGPWVGDAVPVYGLTECYITTTDSSPVIGFWLQFDLVCSNVLDVESVDISQFEARLLDDEEADPVALADHAIASRAMPVEEYPSAASVFNISIRLWSSAAVRLTARDGHTLVDWVQRPVASVIPSSVVTNVQPLHPVIVPVQGYFSTNLSVIFRVSFERPVEGFTESNVGLRNATEIEAFASLNEGQEYTVQVQSGDRGLLVGIYLQELQTIFDAQYELSLDNGLGPFESQLVVVAYELPVALVRVVSSEQSDPYADGNFYGPWNTSAVLVCDATHLAVVPEGEEAPSHALDSCSVSWHLDSDGATESLQEALINATQYSASNLYAAGGAFIASRTYTISAQVFCAANMSYAVVSNSLQVYNPADVPLYVDISEDNNTAVTVTGGTALHSVVHYYTCTPSNPQLVYNWTIAGGSDSMESDDNCDGSAVACAQNINLSGDRFRPGAWYTLQLAVYVSGVEEGTVATDRITLDVASSPLLPAIAGGDRVHAVNAALTLDARSTSSDPDYFVQGLSPNLYSFYWSCTLHSPNAGSDCNSVLAASNRSSGVLIVPAATLIASRTYRFTVVVNDVRDGEVNDARTANVSALVTAVASTAAVPSFVTDMSSYRATIGSRLYITGAATGSNSSGVALTLRWSISGAGAAGIDLGQFSVAPNGYTTETLRGSVQHTLILEAGVLGETFQSMTVTLRATQGSSTNTISATLARNYAPSGGLCTVLPAQGEALVTLFTISCSGWTDDSADLPLRYSMHFQGNASDESTSSPLTTASLSPTTRTVLPATVEAGGRIFFRIADRFGAVATASALVNVSALAGNPAQQLAAMSNAASNALALAESGDFNAAIRIAAVVGLSAESGSGFSDASESAKMEFAQTGLSVMSRALGALSGSATTVTQDVFANSAATLNLFTKRPELLSSDSQELAIGSMEALLGVGGDGSVTGLSPAVASTGLQAIDSVFQANVLGDASVTNDTDRQRLQNVTSRLLQTIDRLASSVAALQGQNDAAVEVSQASIGIRTGRSLLSSLDSSSNIELSGFSDVSVGLPSGLASAVQGGNSGSSSGDIVDIRSVVFKDNPYRLAGENQTTKSSVLELKVAGSDGDEYAVRGLTNPIELKLQLNLSADEIELAHTIRMVAQYDTSVAPSVDNITNFLLDELVTLIVAVRVVDVVDAGGSLSNATLDLVQTEPGAVVAALQELMGLRAAEWDAAGVRGFAPDPLFSTLVPKCTYWDEETAKWSTEGCESLMNYTSQLLTCRCTHLTSFAGTMASELTGANWSVLGTSPDWSNPTGFIIIGTILIIFLFLLWPSIRLDRNETLKLRTLVENAAARTKWLFHLYAAHAAQRKIAARAASRQHVNAVVSLVMSPASFCAKVKDQHKYLQPFFASTVRSFSHVGRLILLFTSILLELFISALWYNGAEGEPPLMIKIARGIYSTLLAAPVLVVLGVLFARSSTTRKRQLGYVEEIRRHVAATVIQRRYRGRAEDRKAAGKQARKSRMEALRAARSAAGRPRSRSPSPRAMAGEGEAGKPLLQPLSKPTGPHVQTLGLPTSSFSRHRRGGSASGGGGAKEEADTQPAIGTGHLTIAIIPTHGGKSTPLSPPSPRSPASPSANETSVSNGDRQKLQMGAVAGQVVAARRASIGAKPSPAQVVVSPVIDLMSKPPAPGFKPLPSWMEVFSFGLAAGTCGFCCFFIVQFSFAFGSTTTLSWLFSFFMGFLCDSLVINPLRIALIAWFIPRAIAYGEHCCRRMKRKGGNNKPGVTDWLASLCE